MGPDQLELTCSTAGGNVAATLCWSCRDAITDLPAAIVAAVESSNFDCPLKPLRVHNLRLVMPDATRLNVGLEAPALFEQLAGELED